MARIKLLEPVVAPEKPGDKVAKPLSAGTVIEVDDDRLIALGESGVRFEIMGNSPEVTTHITTEKSSEPDPKGNSDPKNKN